MCPYGIELSDEWAMVSFTPAGDELREDLDAHADKCRDCKRYYEDNILSRIYHKQAERVTA